MSASALQIRFAVTKDLSALMELERTIENAPHWSEASWDEAVAGFSGGDAATVWPLRRAALVAESDGAVAGFLVLQWVAGMAEIESLGVSPQHRRKGIAQALCLEGIGWAQLQGAEAMELEVRASNAAAIALYVTLGFAEQGLRRAYYSDPVEDAVLMSRAL